MIAALKRCWRAYLALLRCEDCGARHDNSACPACNEHRKEMSIW
jgi:hypothetical protein